MDGNAPGVPAYLSLGVGSSWLPLYSDLGDLDCARESNAIPSPTFFRTGGGPPFLPPQRSVTAHLMQTFPPHLDPKGPSSITAPQLSALLRPLDESSSAPGGVSSRHPCGRGQLGDHTPAPGCLSIAPPLAAGRWATQHDIHLPQWLILHWVGLVLDVTITHPYNTVVSGLETARNSVPGCGWTGGLRSPPGIT
eukprot:766822-Hanusia_phi.AAC.1